MMLKGRESLIRLIGRRRRFLPHRHSLLSSSAPQGLPVAPKEDKDEFSIRNGGEDMVDCPVCGKQVPGENHVINSHLDKCLARGTKRKLSQCTLFQFCKRPNVTASLVESEFTSADVGPSAYDGNCSDMASEFSSSAGTENNVQDESNSSSVSLTLTANRFKITTGETSACNRVDIMENLDGLVKFDDKCKLLSGAKSTFSGLEDSHQQQISDDRIDNIRDPPSSLSENGTSKCVEPLEDYDNYKFLLDTFIVGRKFGDDAELTTGAMLMLSRDSENVKDPNAIKVLTNETGHSTELGFIPRELAQYLSPLIDNFQLRFELSQFRYIPLALRLLAERTPLVSKNSIPFGETLYLLLNSPRLALLSLQNISITFYFY